MNEEYCHACSLEEEQKNNESNNKEPKMEDSGLICSEDLKIKEIKVKMPGFNCVFSFGENLHFITSKGIQTWGYKKGDESQILKPQIIINQVEMLQFPIDKFSFGNI